MELSETTKKNIRILECGLFIIFLIGALGYAGRCDHRDYVRCVMQNNGSYYRLMEEHPDWSETEVIEYYIEENKK